jgi:ABC-type phosphate transport system auxiliary subunit
MSLSLKTNIMSRLKQNQNIDSVIQVITTITKNQCSLSEQDLSVLNEASEKLQALKRKKGKTNEQILQELVKAVELIIKFFL